MPVTYSLIGSVTVGSGGASSVEFTNIPQVYTDLILKVSGRTNETYANNGFFGKIEFNNNTSSYSRRSLYNFDGAAYSFAANDAYLGLSMDPSNFTANTFSNSETYIPNYAGSNNKSVSSDTVIENNGTNIYGALIAGLWSNTSAITSIKLTSFAGSFVQYTTAYLYGIKKS